MKKINLLMGTLIVFLLPFSLLGYQENYSSYNHYTFARLSYVKGDVYLQRAADLGYEEGVVNMPISEGDRLGTTNGQAEIYLGKRNYLRLDYNTKVDFLNLPRRGYDFIAFRLWAGNIYLRVNFLEREKSLEIKTPDADFYVLEEGLYRIDVRDIGETELYVLDGLVEAVGDEGSILVKSEQTVELVNGRFTSRPTYFSAYLRDDFDEWNRYRDSEINRRVSRTYLPEEIGEYERELNNYGRWVYQSPYGYVWIPVSISYGWRPFYYGRWIWLPLCGWTWVPYEPWGWVTYHYGRWHWSPVFGWYWIPTTVWGPAWVYWYWGIDYIGWGPLSYYGYPVVITNNYCYVRGYYNSVPVNSRATVFIHKNQLRARNVSKAALSQKEMTKITSLSKISISKTQPPVRPVGSKIVSHQLSGKKVLLKKDNERMELRKLQKTTSERSRSFTSPEKYSSSKGRITTRFKKFESSSSKSTSKSKTSQERKILKKDRSDYSYPSSRYFKPQGESSRKIKSSSDYSSGRKSYSDRYRIYRYSESTSRSEGERKVSSSKSRSFLNDILNHFSSKKSYTKPQRSSSSKSYRKSSYRSSGSSRVTSRSYTRSSSSRSSSSRTARVKKKD